MKQKKKLKVIAIVMSIVMMSAFVPVYAEPTAETPQPATSATGTITPSVQESESIIQSTEGLLNDGIATAASGSSYELFDYSIVPDGIYAFRNIGNTNRWMDIQFDSTDPGYHVQQYAYGTSPTQSSGNPGLYKVTRVNDSLGLYTIRLMINQNLSFGFSGSEILTKTIPANDSSVSIYDMFYIQSYGSGYTIRPYGSSNYVSAKNTTASGMGGAPDSYLTPRTISSAGNRAVWAIEGYRTFIDEGVYAFENKYVANCWIDTEQDFSTPGHHLQQYDYSDVPTVNFNRGALFKIAEDEEEKGLYIIRSMLNNYLSFEYSDNEVLTCQISDIDDYVPKSSMYYIVFDNGGYYIRAYGESRVIATDRGGDFGAAGAPESYLDLFYPSQVGDMAKWELIKYTGVGKWGITFYYTGSFMAGKAVDFEARTWCTAIHANNYTTNISASNNIITAGLHFPNSEHGEYWAIDLHDEGTVTIRTQLKRGNDFLDYSFSNSKIIELPFREGNYCIGNAYTGKYLQADNGDEHYLETHNYSDSEAKQKWMIQHYRDGFYTLMNIDSRLYMTSPTSSSTNERIYESSFEEDCSDRQTFKLTELAEDYHYTIQSPYMINNNLFVSEESNPLFDRAVQQRSFNEKSEWYFSNCNDKAIVIVPGITCSHLALENGEHIWLNDIDIPDVYIFDGMSKIACDENGNSIRDDVLPYNPDNYGVLNYYKDIYNELQNAYIAEYDILFFAYDWRMSCADAAEQLERVLSNYDECILIAHSMGGLVASSYLDASAENRQKVDKFISIGTPYTGAPKALYVMETGDLMRIFDISIQEIFNLKEYAKNMPAVYELLPTSEYFDSYTSYISNENGDIDGFSASQSFMDELDWATKSNGQVKSMFQNAIDFHSSLINNGTHIANDSSIDTYKIVGVGINTVFKVQYDDNNYVDCVYLDDGDGTVPAYSASNNQSLDSEKVYTLNNTHTGLIESNACIDLIKSIIDETNSTAMQSFCDTANLQAVANSKITIVAKNIESLNIYNEEGYALYIRGNTVYYTDNNGTEHEAGSCWYLGNNSWQYLLNNDLYVLSDIISTGENSNIRIDYNNHGLTDNAICMNGINLQTTISIPQHSNNINTNNILISNHS